jgi:hypothetical protein
MLFTNPSTPNVFPSFIWKAFGGSFSAPSLMGSEFRGVHSLIDAFKIYTTDNYYWTGSLTCYPRQSLWTTGNYYDCYTADFNLGANTYAILMW